MTVAEGGGNGWLGKGGRGAAGPNAKFSTGGGEGPGTAMNLAQMGLEDRAGVEAGCGQGCKCRPVRQRQRPCGGLEYCQAVVQNRPPIQACPQRCRCEELSETQSVVEGARIAVSMRTVLGTIHVETANSDI